MKKSICSGIPGHKAWILVQHSGVGARFRYRCVDSNPGYTGKEGVWKVKNKRSIEAYKLHLKYTNCT